MSKKKSFSVKDYKRIFDEVEHPVFILENYKFIYANEHFAKLIGKKNLSKHCWEVFECSEKGTDDCDVKKVEKNKKGFSKLVSYEKNKKEHWFNLEISSLKDSDEKIRAFLFNVLDASDYVNQESKIIKSNAELRIIKNIAVSLNQLDLEQLSRNVVSKLYQNLSLSVCAVHLLEQGEYKLKVQKGMSKKFEKYVKSIENDKKSIFISSLNKKTYYVKNSKKWKRLSNDVYKRLEETGARSHVSVPLKKENKLIGFLSVARDKINGFTKSEISLLQTIADQIALAIENVNLFNETRKLCSTDLLTGLNNYSCFEETLKKEIQRSRRNDTKFSILMINLDNLSYVNDFYGHEAGDRIIKKYADLLNNNLRKSDITARHAGDEFLVLLPEVNEEQARRVAEKIRKKTARIRLFGSDKKQLVTSSIGMANFPISGTSVSSLIKSADLAMVQAKVNGRNQVCIYDPSMLQTITFDTGKIKEFVKGADLSTVQSLVTAVDLKDNYTQRHSSEVSRLAVSLGQALGREERELEQLRVSGLLHDIGKIGISDTILLKNGPLSKPEFEQIKKHPDYGVNILKHSKRFKDTLPIVLHHHERFDGKGYPDGIKSKLIPYLARIMAIADAYQAMISDRPYRKGFSKEEAITELKRCAGSQFDPKMIDIFVSILFRIETGMNELKGSS